MRFGFRIYREFLIAFCIDLTKKQHELSKVLVVFKLSDGINAKIIMSRTTIVVQTPKTYNTMINIRKYALKS